MPAAHWNQSSDDLDEFEYPDTGDIEDETTETIPCPECQADVYEDAEQCPVCGSYLIHRSSIWDSKPTWWVLLALLGIIAVVVTLVFGQ